MRSCGIQKGVTVRPSAPLHILKAEVHGIQDVHLLCNGQQAPAHAGIVGGAGDTQHIQQFDKDMGHAGHHAGGTQEHTARQLPYHGVRVIDGLQRKAQQTQQFLVPGNNTKP